MKDAYYDNYMILQKTVLNERFITHITVSSTLSTMYLYMHLQNTSINERSFMYITEKWTFSTVNAFMFSHMLSTYSFITNITIV